MRVAKTAHLDMMRTAIVHYWLLGRCGGEKVGESLSRIMPEADVFTLSCDPAALGPELRCHRITASFSQSAGALTFRSCH
jgi:hypothetical protein